LSLAGSKLAGGNPENERVENDFYATNPKALTMLLDVYEFNGIQFLEPCVGEGHLANEIKNYYELHSDRDIEVDCFDIVDRGYPNTNVTDFITLQTDKKYDGIITNPPFSMAQECSVWLSCIYQY